MPFNFLDPFVRAALRIRPGAELEFFDLRRKTVGIDNILHDMSAINDKSSALLGHISLMIAAVSFFVSQTPGKVSSILLLVELVAYVLCSLLILRCLDVMGPPFRMPPSNDVERADYYFAEVELRRSLFVTALRAVWLLTAFLAPIVAVRYIWNP